MKIGDRVFVHGYIDEIRKDIVIIRNNGGYFGTVPSEVVTGELPSAQPELPDWVQKVEEYRKSAPSIIHNPLAWALYQTWKEYNGQLVHQRGKENR